MENEDFNNIVEAIENGTCIVVLGTELCRLKISILEDQQQPEDFDESIKLAYSYYLNKVNTRLDKSKTDYINFEDHFFNKENLWVYNHDDEEHHLFSFAQWFFEQTEGWQKPYNKLVEIPLPLIISLLPDKHLEQTFKEKNQNFYVSRYSRFNDSNVSNDLEELNSNKTLIYKLLGDIKENDATFTFEHWFDFFNQIFKEDPPLPNKIINALRKAKIILFLGVKIEKWYVQLLVKLLYSVGSHKMGRYKAIRYALSNKQEKNEILLASRRLNIIFDDKNPEKLINQLHDALQAKNLLRATKETSEKINAKVFISYNHTDKDIANRLKADLEKVGITIIIDSDNPIGFEIPKFIHESIKEADFIIQLISANFLTSSWVAEESILAFASAKTSNKRVLPCETDDSLRKDTFIESAILKIEEKTGLLDTKIEERKTHNRYASTKDLDTERNYLIQLLNSYADTVDKFKTTNRGDLRGNNYTDGVQKIIKSIKEYLSNAKFQ